MAVEQIKHHPFFYGVNWNIIRNIEAPFVPRLRSITDTSYFPTDELEQVPDEPTAGDSTGANKDLAFLGCVHHFMRFQGYVTAQYRVFSVCRYTFKRFTISSNGF